MSSLFQKILQSVLVYKYAALFIVAFLSSLGIPLPAGSSTMASAAFAGQGYLNIVWVCVAGALGNILGDISMYALSKRYGKKVLYFLRLKKVAESEALKRIESAEKHYSAWAIIASRFQDQATTIVNIIAGLGKMKFQSFVTLAIIGDILQIIFYAGIGYFFAANWQAFYHTVGIFGWLILALTLIAGFFIGARVKGKLLQ